MGGRGEVAQEPRLVERGPEPAHLAARRLDARRDLGGIPLSRGEERARGEVAIGVAGRLCRVLLGGLEQRAQLIPAAQAGQRRPDDPRVRAKHQALDAEAAEVLPQRLGERERLLESAQVEHQVRVEHPCEEPETQTVLGVDRLQLGDRRLQGPQRVKWPSGPEVHVERARDGGVAPVDLGPLPAGQGERRRELVPRLGEAASVAVGGGQEDAHHRQHRRIGRDAVAIALARLPAPSRAGPRRDHGLLETDDRRRRPRMVSRVDQALDRLLGLGERGLMARAVQQQPDLGEDDRRAVLPERPRDRVEPSGERLALRGQDHPLRDRLDRIHRGLLLPGLEQVAHDLRRLTLSRPPCGRPPMPLAQPLRLALAQASLQERLEEMVVAIPLPLGGQADREQVPAHEPPRDVGGVRAPADRGRQLGGEPPEHGGVEQELLNLRRLPGDDLLGQVVELRRAQAGRGGVPGLGREDQARGPPLGAVVEPGDGVVVRLHSQRADQLGGLAEVEREPVLTDLDDPESPETRQRERQGGAAGKGQVGVGRQMVHEHAEAVERRRRQQVHVVEHEHEVVGHRLDDLVAEVGHGLLRRASGLHPSAEAREALPDALGHVRQQGARIAHARVAGAPHPDAVGGLERLGQQGGLPVAGARHDRHQPALEALLKRGDQLGAVHAVGRKPWRQEPGSQHAAGGRAGGPRARRRSFRRCVPRHLVGGDGLLQALQRQRSEGPEVVLASRADQSAHELGREDLPSLRHVAQPARDHDGRAEVVVLVADRLAHVEAHPDHQGLVRPLIVVLTCRLLHRHGAGDGLDRAAEDDHEAVAQRLDLLSATGPHGLAQELEVRLPDALGAGVAEPVQDLGGAHEVGEQQRDHLRRGPRDLRNPFTCSRRSHPAPRLADGASLARPDPNGSARSGTLPVAEQRTEARVANDFEVVMDMAAPPDAVWALAGDPGRIGEWFAPVAACEMDGDVRTVTMGNGAVLVERVERDDPARAYSYSVLSGIPGLTSHRATLRVVEAPAARGRCGARPPPRRSRATTRVPARRSDDGRSRAPARRGGGPRNGLSAAVVAIPRRAG